MCRHNATVGCLAVLLKTRTDIVVTVFYLVKVGQWFASVAWVDLANGSEGWLARDCYLQERVSETAMSVTLLSLLKHETLHT